MMDQRAKESKKEKEYEPTRVVKDYFTRKTKINSQEVTKKGKRISLKSLFERNCYKFPGIDKIYEDEEGPGYAYLYGNKDDALQTVIGLQEILSEIYTKNI